jgi:hypothetical protein
MRPAPPRPRQVVTTPPPAPRITWQRLLALEPELSTFEASGAQAGANRWSGWPSWVAHYGDFVALLRRLPEGAEGVVVEHLRRVHREAFRGSR